MPRGAQPGPREVCPRQGPSGTLLQEVPWILRDLQGGAGTPITTTQLAGPAPSPSEIPGTFPSTASGLAGDTSDPGLLSPLPSLPQYSPSMRATYLSVGDQQLRHYGNEFPA